MEEKESQMSALSQVFIYDKLRDFRVEFKPQKCYDESNIQYSIIVSFTELTNII